MIDKRPALIVRCAGVADVIHCINFTQANSLLVAVRGGGNNISGNAMCDASPTDSCMRRRSDILLRSVVGVRNGNSGQIV